VARAACLLIFLAFASCGTKPLSSDRVSAPADGSSVIHLNAPAVIKSGVRSGHMESPTVLRTSVLPGSIVLASGTSFLTITTTAVVNDSSHDGTPDFLRLESPADREAFSKWFTFLAEAQFIRVPLPREIGDCAALIRYAYRETLSVHNDAWVDTAHLPEIPSIPAVQKYTYPFTPLGANLFRIHPGNYTPADTGNGNFAQFADAETLVRFNAHFISKDVEQAQPSDILLYRQFDANMPFHTMIYLGPSQLERTPGPYVVYHTGPIHGKPGEVRRPTLSELQSHPDPRWRPFPANSNFLGIYRWNIL
jgi:uncharacterized protein YfaT (DUF1175 family)